MSIVFNLLNVVKNRMLASILWINYRRRCQHFVNFVFYWTINFHHYHTSFAKKFQLYRLQIKFCNCLFIDRRNFLTISIIVFVDDISFLNVKLLNAFFSIKFVWIYLFRIYFSQIISFNRINFFFWFVCKNFSTNISIIKFNCENFFQIENFLQNDCRFAN